MKEKVKKILDDKRMPLGAKDWNIDPVNYIMGWSVEADFYQTTTYTLEGLHKPIGLAIKFNELVELEKRLVADEGN